MQCLVTKSLSKVVQWDALIVNYSISAVSSYNKNPHFHSFFVGFTGQCVELSGKTTLYKGGVVDSR